MLRILSTALRAAEGRTIRTAAGISSVTDTVDIARFAITPAIRTPFVILIYSAMSRTSVLSIAHMFDYVNTLFEHLFAFTKVSRYTHV